MTSDGYNCLLSGDRKNDDGIDKAEGWSCRRSKAEKKKIVCDQYKQIQHDAERRANELMSKCFQAHNSPTTRAKLRSQCAVSVAIRCLISAASLYGPAVWFSVLAERVFPFVSLTFLDAQNFFNNLFIFSWNMLNAEGSYNVTSNEEKIFAKYLPGKNKATTTSEVVSLSSCL